MKEQEFYHDLIQSKIVHDGKVKAYCRAAKREKAVSLRRILLPAAVGFAVLMLSAAAVPAIRAEVLSWFGITEPSAYLVQDPEERTQNEALESLITTPEPAPEGGKVTFVADDPLWQKIAEDFDATLGQTLYDGTNLYQIVDFAPGLCGLPVYENEYACDLPADIPAQGLLTHAIAPDQAFHFYEDDANVSEFLSGKSILWMGPSTSLLLTLPDGSLLGSRLFMEPRSEDLAFFKESGRTKFGEPENQPLRTQEEVDAFNEATVRHLNEHGLRAVMTCPLWSDYPEEYMTEDYRRALANADENGILTAKAVLRVSNDLGDDSEPMLTAELGTVQIDLKAFSALPERTFSGLPDRVPWSGQIRFTEHAFDEQTPYVTNYLADADGLSLQAVKGTIDALGVRDLTVSVQLPAGWTDAQKRAWINNLEFGVEINGEVTPFTCAGYPDQLSSDRYTVTISRLDGIPYDQLDAIQSIRLIPTRLYDTEIRVVEDRPVTEHQPEVVLRTVPLGETDTFRGDSLEPGTRFIGVGDSVSYPEFAVSFAVK